MSAFPQPLLQSARLRLREFRTDDADDLFAIHSDPQVMRYWSFPAWTDIEQAQVRLAFIAQQRAQQPICIWAIAEPGSDRLIGNCTAFAIDQIQGRAEIGYCMNPKWQGQGLASEALQLVLGHLFDGLQLRRIEADIDPRNGPSCRLVERHGFVREGLLRERWNVNNERCDTALYGLLRREWRRPFTPQAADVAAD
jgi:RimJ/RimL family protein N-acetyltransferase